MIILLIIIISLITFLIGVYLGFVWCIFSAIELTKRELLKTEQQEQHRLNRVAEHIKNRINKNIQ